jgi:hypothetical protein
MKRTERNNLNTAKLNRRATIGKSREVGHRQTKEAAKPSVVLAIRK